jgi:hypothetical protein
MDCPYQNLVQKVLDELLLKRSRGKEAVEVGSEKLSDKVADSSVRKSPPGPLKLLTCPPREK